MMNSNNGSTIKLEEEKMLAGEPYQAFDPVLLAQRQQAKSLLFQYNNQLDPTVDQDKRQEILLRLFFPERKDNVNEDHATPLPKIWIESPFHVDYGRHLHLGENFYANHGCTILDCNSITIGKNALLAPHVCISAATHPVDDFEARAAGVEFSEPIVIGDNVWIGANATICPGVVLGDNVVVGAGAVVAKGVFPGNVVIGGVPAKIIRKVKQRAS